MRWVTILFLVIITYINISWCLDKDKVGFYGTEKEMTLSAETKPIP